MNNQYLQFVREELIIATADLSGATKGQLEAWQENAMFDTGRYRRKKIRYRDEVTGKMITRDNRKRLVRTVLIFTESSDQLSRATDRVPGLPASPGYVQ